MKAIIRITEKYETREYTKQRLEMLELTTESTLESDKDKPWTRAKFM